jgi:hypothetical protein
MNYTIRYSDPYTHTVILRLEDEYSYKEIFLTQTELEQLIKTLETGKELLQ